MMLTRTARNNGKISINNPEQRIASAMKLARIPNTITKRSCHDIPMRRMPARLNVIIALPKNTIYTGKNNFTSYSCAYKNT